MTAAGALAGRMRHGLAEFVERAKGRLFRKYAALLVALVGSALVISAAIESYYSYEENRAALVAIQREKAIGAATVIEQFVKEIEGQVGWTTHATFVTGQSGAEQRRFDFLRLLRQAPAITEVAYLDAQGREQLRVSRLSMDVAGSGVDRSGELQFRQAKERRRHMSEVYFRKESEPYMTLSIAGPGRNSGVTVAEVNLKFIWDVISRMKVGKAGAAYVVDNRGLLIAHPDIGLVLRKTDLSASPQVAAARSSPMTSGTGAVFPSIARDPTGREVLTASAPVESLGWHVFVDLPTSEAFESLYASLLRSGLVLLSGLGLAALAGLWLAQRMVVPIRALAAGAAKIGAGNLDHRLDIRTGDEVETLAAGFNEMGARLKESYQGLERKVEARTQELQESLEYQTATAEVLGVISRSPYDLQPVLDAIAATSRRLCGSDRTTIWRIEGDKYRLASSVGVDDATIKYFLHSPISPGRGSIIGRVALENKTIYVPNVAADRELTLPAGQPTTKPEVMLGVPLVRNGRPIGAIGQTRNTKIPFTDRQIALVETFADQAVIAIENTRLFEEVQARTRELTEALHQQTATADVLKVISRSTFDLQKVLDVLVETVAKLCEADGATLARQIGDEYVRAGLYGFDEAFVEVARRTRFVPNRGSVSGRALIEARTIQIVDVREDPEYEWTEAIEIGRIRTAVGIPLMREQTPIGVISLARFTVKPFTEKQIELLQTFADQAAIAIENSRLFEAEQTRTRELTEALEYQTATGEVLNVISQSRFDLEPVLQSVVDTAARLCRAEKAIIYRLEGGTYRFAAGHGNVPEYQDIERKTPIPPGPGTLVGRTAMAKSTVQIADALADPEYEKKDDAKVGRVRSMIGVPLLREGEPIGVIALAREQVAPFNQREVDLVTTFADQAAIAIENVRLFEAEQTRTRELARSVNELEALGEVGRAVSSTLDLDKVLETVVAEASDLGAADGCAIFRYKESDRTFRLWQVSGLDAELEAQVRALKLKAAETAMGKSIATREAIQLGNIEAGPDNPLRRLAVAAGFKSVLFVPLVRGERAFGVLVLQRKKPGEFDAATVSLLKTFASQSTLAIQNARLFREVEEKGEQLAVASRHKSQFLANMSHELRTPLNAVLGYTELIQDGVYGAMPPKVDAVLARVQSNGRHLLGLINDVLDLSKIEAGQLQLGIDDYSMASLVHTVVAATEPLAAAKKLPIKLELPAQLPPARGDERRISQVLLNLLGNAIKFTESGEIRISAGVEGDHFVVSVADTGPGIPEAEQAKIFEEFHQVDSSNTKTKGGTGLGLAISRRIVEMHGGRISVASVVGTGSKFTVELPVAVQQQIGGP